MSKSPMSKEMNEFIHEFAKTNAINTADGNPDTRGSAEAIIRAAMNLTVGSNKNIKAAKALFQAYAATLALLGDSPEELPVEKAPKAPKAPKEPKVAKAPKEPKAAKAPKAPKEPKAPKAPKEPKADIGNLAEAKAVSVVVDSKTTEVKNWRGAYIFLAERALSIGKGSEIPANFLKDEDSKQHKVLSNGRFLYVNLNIDVAAQRAKILAGILGETVTVNVDRAGTTEAVTLA